MVLLLQALVILAASSPAQNHLSNIQVTGDQPKLVAQLGHPRITGVVRLSPDGRFLLSTGKDWSKEAILWDFATGLELLRLKDPRQAHFLSAAFSHDSRYIVTGTENGVVSVWEVSTGRQIERFNDFKGETPKLITFVAFSVDDLHLVIGSRPTGAVVRAGDMRRQKTSMLLLLSMSWSAQPRQ